MVIRYNDLHGIADRRVPFLEVDESITSLNNTSDISWPAKDRFTDKPVTIPALISAAFIAIVAAIVETYVEVIIPKIEAGCVLPLMSRIAVLFGQEVLQRQMKAEEQKRDAEYNIPFGIAGEKIHLYLNPLFQLEMP